MIEELKAAQVILLDSNLLVLYLVGTLEERLVGTHKRTRNYSVDDFFLLQAIVASKKGLVTTPNILTEVSNLAAQIGEPARSNLMELLAYLCRRFDERYIESALAVQGCSFTRLGITDAGLVDLCLRGLLLLTDDLDLYLEAGRLGGAAVNFNHIRTVAWT